MDSGGGVGGTGGVRVSGGYKGQGWDEWDRSGAGRKGDKCLGLFICNMFHCVKTSHKTHKLYCVSL